MQLEIQEMGNTEGRSEVSCTWKATEARRVGKIAQEKDAEKRFLVFIRG